MTAILIVVAVILMLVYLIGALCMHTDNHHGGIR